MIEKSISAISYIITLILLNCINFRMYKTVLNPLFLLSVPFSIIILCCVLFNDYMNFLPFHFESLWIWIGGLCVFFIGGTVNNLFFKKKMYLNKTIRKISFPEKHYQLFIVIFLLCLIIAFFKFHSLSFNLIDEIGSKELGDEIGSGGFVGRASNIILMSIPFFVVYKMPRIVKTPIFLILIFITISLGSKTWITYALVASFLIYSSSNWKIKPRLIFIILFLLVLSFFLYYKLNTSIDDANSFLGFAGRHLYFYITSGALPMGKVYQNDFQAEEVVFPFIRLFNIWMGRTGIFHSSNLVTTDLTLGTDSNVFTFFGSLFLSKSLFDFVFYSFLSGFISYLVFELYRLSKENIFLGIAWGYTGAILFFGWYNWGFGLLRIWEIYFYCIVFSAISNYRIR
ncbi:MAG: oligosaccharide repeat unit polymerase [Paramuribaculum sp.]|nr:oligosaccharide repeat unit polymerase [Paramuribaculum sp.]